MGERTVKSERVGVVGAGIMGLAHAWSAAKLGHRVTVFERSPRALGASIRNFGMIFPLAQPESLSQLAEFSRSAWLELAEQAGLWVQSCGSIHLAYRPDEWKVLQEFFELCQSGPLKPHLQLLSSDDCLKRSPAIREQGLLGGLASDLELRVEAGSALQVIADWLQQRFSIEFLFHTPVTTVDSSGLTVACGKRFALDRVLICSGADLQTLFPDEFGTLGLVLCKLQMMRTVRQPDNWILGPHLAGGLTLRHYPTFRNCSSLGHLIERIAQESPELDRYGIHVLVSQDRQGRIILGDSHEYGPDLPPFHSVEIDRLIMRELRGMVHLPSWELESHWSGVYAKPAEPGPSTVSPVPNVYLCTGVGGSGMTLAFGIADQNWKGWS